MKVDKPPAIAQLLKGPAPEFRVALFYGPDQGLVRERATLLARRIVADLHDPFNVSELTSAAAGAELSRLHDEMSAQSLMGGRRLVRIAGADNATAPGLQNVLNDLPPGDSFLILEAGELGPTSPVRKLCEGSPAAAAVPCYVADARELGRWCGEVLHERQIGASPDALALLAGSMADDRGVARQELEKLMTYLGDRRHLDFEDVRCAIGDSAEMQLDEPAWAVGEGAAALCDRALDRLFCAGASPVPILRAAMRHFTRLLEVAGSDAPLGQAIDNLKPPVFWKDKDRFRRQAELWSERRLRLVLLRLAETEAACKRTGLRDTTMAARALLTIAAAVRR